jgi:hypothetical protein
MNPAFATDYAKASSVKESFGWQSLQPASLHHRTAAPPHHRIAARRMPHTAHRSISRFENSYIRCKFVPDLNYI